MGQPYGGFPEKLQKMVLKGEEPITVRPGLLLDDEDYESDKVKLEKILRREPTEEDLISYSLYPKVLKNMQSILKNINNFGEWVQMFSSMA